MKAITFTIDLKSFLLGVLTVCGLLILVNFTPVAQPNTQSQPDQHPQRYQAIAGKDTRTIIMDTQTGRFLVERPTIGLPTWAPMDFEELYRKR